MKRPLAFQEQASRERIAPSPGADPSSDSRRVTTATALLLKLLPSVRSSKCLRLEVAEDRVVEFEGLVARLVVLPGGDLGCIVSEHLANLEITLGASFYIERPFGPRRFAQ